MSESICLPLRGVLLQNHGAEIDRLEDPALGVFEAIEAYQDAGIRVFIAVPWAPDDVDLTLAMILWLLRNGFNPERIAVPAMIPAGHPLCKVYDSVTAAHARPLEFVAAAPEDSVLLAPGVLRFSGVFPTAAAVRQFEPWHHD